MENSMRCFRSLQLLCVVLLLSTLFSASALASYSVYVGYADDVRSSPFFPNPWQGSPNTIFAGQGSGVDCGALMVVNTGGSAITFNDLIVDQFGDGAVFQIWGGYAGTSIGVGKSMIFSQTVQYNFDSSDDWGGNPLAIPRVRFTIDGVANTYMDTGQVLNTGGTDALALAGLNESHQWRPIGTFGGQAGVPLPAAAWSGMALLAGLGAARILRRRSR
jgi:hypothetical protein